MVDEDDNINSGDSSKKPIGTSSDLNLSFGDSLYLHPNDTSGSPIVTVKLTSTENYKIWSIAMTFALINHNKLGFIDGTCKKDDSNPALANQWEMRQTSYATVLKDYNSWSKWEASSGKQRNAYFATTANGKVTCPDSAPNQREKGMIHNPDIPEVALMANLSHYGSDALAEVHNHDNINNNVAHQAVQVMPSSKQSNVVNHLETEITSDSNIIPYSQYVIESQQSKLKLYVGDIIVQTNPIVIPDSERLLALAEESHSKMLLKHKDNMMLEKEKQVDTTPIDYVALNKDFSTRFVPQTELSAEQAFWSKNYVNSSEPILSIIPTNVEVPKELPKVENDSVNVHECQKCLKLETELQTNFVKRETYDKLFKSFTILEKHCISLEVDTQLKQEIFQRENSVSNQSVPSWSNV
ncbi:retrovirus-related pol polyprotein from transposon TNT 1-94 [Tanacetum coccineum]